MWDETGDAEGLLSFLADLGSREDPWSGVLEWESIEGNLKLSVVCSVIGNVIFDFELRGLRGLQGAAEEWVVAAGIDYELGGLEHVAANARITYPRNTGM